MQIKIQTDSFHQFAIDSYGIGGQVSREKILTDIQREIDVDYDGAETLLLLMVGVNYFKELNDSLIVASKTGEYFDNSLIKYWLSR